VRIRQVKPAFWSDAKVATLKAPVRLFYIGLWMVADDAGYFRNEPSEIARDLYGYEPRTRRERNVAEWTSELVAVGRVVVLECGHGIVPKLAEHQHLAAEAKQVRTIFAEHSRCTPQLPADVPENPSSNGKGKGRGNGDGQGIDKAVEFSERVPRPGNRAPEALSIR
jgi:hypothetical protein